MARSTVHLVPDTLPQAELLARLQSALPAKLGATDAHDESYYDTFDARLHHAGLRLVRTDATSGSDAYIRAWFKVGYVL